ncbi:hypothetical protein LIER_10332 [Lithospermum erythrorhizon]|uniref:Uncharacterized protein n=1 Tax=Lithospermum erythrorhizon TaxID=34254 RepID=A0AAV3PLR7_LITER
MGVSLQIIVGQIGDDYECLNSKLVDLVEINLVDGNCCADCLAKEKINDDPEVTNFEALPRGSRKFSEGDAIGVAHG